MLNFIWIFLVPLFASAILTGWLRNYALRASLLDVPNNRSSHAEPTPRGGGLAIVIVFLLGLLLLSFAGLCAQNVLLAIFGAGAWVALVGFIDDHGHIAARWRLMAHFLAATWGLYWLGGFPPLALLNGHVESVTINLGWVGHIFGVIYLVWLLNLYNFMDGIDGLASVEAISASLGAILFVITGLEPTRQEWLLVLMCATVTGFLIWNFPPAKIFMGDAGSGFLGLVLGLCSIQAGWINAQLFWSWLILLGVFIVDASFTLLRRFFRGEKVYEAHRSHAYQIASRLARSHKQVTLAIGAINLLWLMPIALWVASGNLNGLFGLVCAWSPLVALSVYFNAGTKEC